MTPPVAPCDRCTRTPIETSSMSSSKPILVQKFGGSMLAGLAALWNRDGVRLLDTVVKRAISAAIAGAALVLSGPALAFGFNTVSFVAFLLALARLDIAPRAPRAGAARAQISPSPSNGGDFANMDSAPGVESPLHRVTEVTFFPATPHEFHAQAPRGRFKNRGTRPKTLLAGTGARCNRTSDSTLGTSLADPKNRSVELPDRFTAGTIVSNA